ncbi:hypothetical protein MP228_011608 [Amoeboaphelidium protococcarum]|nr:hypothetical protein MP228_011608 [Amoeboaphelidium protococcarum]
MNGSMFGGIFNVSSVNSTSMRLRDRRLKDAKVHADKNQRELARDRMALERKEKTMLAECKRLLKKGDLVSAQLVAQQIQKFRSLQHRNLTHSCNLELKTQTLISDHKVNQAEVEGVKAWSYANAYETFGGLERRENRMGMRSGAIDHFEDSLRGCVDGLLEEDGVGDVDDGPQYQSGGGADMEMLGAKMKKMELQAIMAQALGKEKRTYFNQPEVVAPYSLIIKSLDQTSDDEGVIVVLNDISKSAQSGNSAPEKPFSVSTFKIDDLKRKIVADSYVSGQLDLCWTPSEQVQKDNQIGTVKPFKIGKLNGGTNEFEPLKFNATLEQLSIKDGDTLYVLTSTAASEPNSRRTSVDPRDEELRHRLNRIRKN